MRALGVDAKVATHVRYQKAFAHFYAQQFESGDHFLFFDTDDQLLHIAAPYEVIVATLWSTPRLVEADQSTLARETLRLLHSGLRALVFSRGPGAPPDCHGLLHPDPQYGPDGQDRLDLPYGWRAPRSARLPGRTQPRSRSLLARQGARRCPHTHRGDDPSHNTSARTCTHAASPQPSRKAPRQQSVHAAVRL